jgi:hypothetical protein
MKRLLLRDNTRRGVAAWLTLMAWVVLSLIHPLTHHDGGGMLDDDSDHCTVCATLAAIAPVTPPPPSPPTPVPVVGEIVLPACPAAVTAYALPSCPRSPPVIPL